MRQLYLSLLCFTFFAIQAQAQSFEFPYPTDVNTPEWVKMMYADNPNVKAVMAAYEAFYKNNTFQKNAHTQYYKRWLRSNLPYLNEAGFIEKPSQKTLDQQLSAYMDKVQQARLQKSSNAVWEELGPWEYDHEATMNLSVQSPGAAHIYTVEQSVSNPDVVIAGTARAGLWKSTDKGITWELVTKDLALEEVYAAEIDPTNENTIYFGAVGKIWKTTDGGTNWTETGGGQYFGWVRDIRTLPNDNMSLLAATNTGLFRTTNGGTTWTQLFGGHFQEIEFHPTNPNTVYAIKVETLGTRFYKSTDGGQTFALKHTGWPGINSVIEDNGFSALTLSGNATNYINMTNNINLGDGAFSDFSIEMRVKSTGSSGDPAIFSNKNWGSGSNAGFVIADKGNGIWKFNIGDGSSRIDLDGGRIDDGEWHHIAVTYSASGDKKVYHDGQLINQSSATLGGSVTTTLDLAIGQDGTLNYGTGFNGTIAEIRIFDNILSDSTIEQWRCQTADNTHPDYANLFHHWKIDEGSGTTLTDAIGSNNGTLNGTESWTLTNDMYCVATNFAAGEEQQRCEISVTPANPNLIYILATGAADGGSGLYGFYKSIDGGESFTFECCGTGPGGAASLTNPNIMGWSFEGTESGGQYYYDVGLGASPTDVDKVFAAGISVHRSEDGGTSWETNGHWVTWVGTNTKDRYTHADVHDVKFFQNGANVDMWVASDGGLYYSSDQGDNIEPRMHGIQGTEFWGFGGSYKEDILLGGTYHNGTLIHYKDVYLKGKNGHAGWFAGAAADLTKGDAHINGEDCFNESGMFTITDRNSYFKWLPFDNSKNLNAIGTAGRYGNYEWHPHCHNIFYSPRDSVLWRTEDNGVTWDMVYDFVTGDIYTIKISAANPDVIYVVHNDVGIVRVWKTVDGGANWTDITPTDATVGFFNYENKIIDIDQRDENILWLMVVGNHDGYKIFKTIDGGTTWTNLTTTALDGEYVLDIAHQQGTDGGLYVGTSRSVFYKNNGMADWALYNDGLPMIARCGYLLPFYTDGKIRVGTYRGAYQCDFFENAPPVAKISADRLQSACPRDTIYYKDLSYTSHDAVQWAWTFEGGTPATSTDESPKVVYNASGTFDVTLTVTDAHGTDTQMLEDFITVGNECEADSIPGNVVSFTGSSSDFVMVQNGNHFNFGSTQDFSVSLWMKTATTSGDATLISDKDWDSGTHKSWVIALQSGQVILNVGDGTNRIDIGSGTAYNDDNWHYITATFDRDGDAKLYVDGILKASTSMTAIGDIFSDLPLTMGADPEQDYPYAGLLEEVKIWDIALTETELREHKHLTEVPASQPNLIAYYQFNEADGDVLDRAGIYHAAINSATRVVSTLAVGHGNSNTQTEQNGLVSFGATNISMDYSNQNAAEVVSTKINLSPYGSTGIGISETLLDAQYWVVNRFGNGTFLGNLVFATSEDLTADDEANPAKLALYFRDFNGDGTWNFLNYANAVDATTNTATFNNINTFNRQFLLTHSDICPPAGLACDDGDPTTINDQTDGSCACLGMFAPMVNKVLIIGIDGCRPDALVAANTPNIDALIANGTYSLVAQTQPPTSSGPGWSSMLTGVWGDKHGVTDNSFSGSNYAAYPHFFKHVKDHDPSLYTASIVHWIPINLNIVDAPSTDYGSVGNDDFISADAVNLLQTADPDVLFLHFDDVDGAGHGNGFSPTVPAYIAEIEEVDTQIGPVIDALNNRPNRVNENWIIIVSTDHGGLGASHGGTSEEEKTIFFIVSGDEVPNQELMPIITQAPTSAAALDFDGTDDYAVIPDVPLFNFGASQDFSIECRVKTNGWSGDPSIISDKNWNSGSFDGFILAGRTDGTTWKVNIGDGSNRIDLNGGTINDDQWHHLTLTCDRDGNATLYQNGALLASQDMSSIGDINSGLPIGIGQDGTLTYSDFFNGQIDEVRIWQKALDETTVADWTCQDVNGTHPDFADLIGHWQMDENTGTTTADATANANSATLNGATWSVPTTSVTCTDHANVPEIVDVAVTALEHLCIPIDPAWGLDGNKVGVNGCGVVMVRAKAILEAVYDPATQLMTTILNTDDLLPLTQPFNRPPWNYTGTETVNAFAPDVVDWVLLEARDATDPNIIIEQKAALLRSDGSIVDIDGSLPGVRFDNLLRNTGYYISIKSRNHLAVLSATGQTLPNAEAQDFTDPANVAGINQLADLGGGVWGCYAGDFNSDGILTVSDFNLYTSQAALLNQYVDGDVNMDKSVTVADFNWYLPNSAVIGVSEIRY